MRSLAPWSALTLVFSLALNAATSSLRAQSSAPSAGQYRITVASASSLMALNERFEFALGEERIALTGASLSATFSKTLSTGASYSVSQVSGPRACEFGLPAQGVVAGADVTLQVNCGRPPLTIIRATFTNIAQGEAFSFADEYRRTLSIAFSGSSNLGGFPQGDTFRYTQKSGPRACRITPQGFPVTATTTQVMVDCGATPGAASGSYRLSGVLSAKPGTRVVLSLNGANDLPVVARVSGTATRTETPFTFAAPVTDGSTYAVSIKTPPAGVRCYVSGGTGTVNGAAPTARVTCGLDWDLATRSSDDKKTATFYETASPSIGGLGADDGRYVAFSSYVAGLGGNTGSKRQVFWRDRHTGITRLVSMGMGGTEGNDDSVEPMISADGKSVVFESSATNLVPIDANGVRDIFIWNAETNTVTAVSDRPGGIEANAPSSQAAVSGDGRFVVFTSSASNLVDGVLDRNTPNVYLKDMQSGAVTLLSVDEKTGKPGSGSRPSISDDGSRVAFHSAVALTADDRNNLWDIFVWDRAWANKRRVTLTSVGQERVQGDESASRVVIPTISGNGKFVAFSTTATNVVPFITGKAQHVYLVDVDTRRISRLSLNNDAVEGDGDSPVEQGGRIAVSGDAKWVAFTTAAKNLGGSVVKKNFVTGETIAITELGTVVGNPVLSRSGDFIMLGVGRPMDQRFGSSGLFVTYR